MPSERQVCPYCGTAINGAAAECPTCGSAAPEPPRRREPIPAAVRGVGAVLVGGPTAVFALLFAWDWTNAAPASPVNWGLVAPWLLGWLLAALGLAVALARRSRVAWAATTTLTGVVVILSAVWCVLGVPMICLWGLGLVMLGVGLPVFLYASLLQTLLLMPATRAWRGGELPARDD